MSHAPSITTIALAALMLAPPATRAAFPTGDTIVTIVFQETRRYTVHVPASYDGSVAVPLVLDFHGYTSNPSQQQGFSGFAPLADATGFIVAYPEGFDPDPAGSHRGWNVGDDPGLAALGFDLDDVGFVRAVVADIQRQANIDPARIYATGLSNGGGLAHRLGCEASDLFAAVAPVAFPLVFEPFAICQPLRPVPILSVAGLTDQVVPYAGGQSAIFPEITFPFPAAQDSFSYWVGANGCGGGPPDVVEDLGNGASCAMHTACLGGVDVGLCSINGTLFFGHVIYVNSDGLAVAQRMWDFLSQFTLPSGTTSPNVCAAAKVKAAGKEAACLLSVAAKAVAIGGMPDTEKTQKCRDALSNSVTKAETKPPCPTLADAGPIDDAIETFAGSLVAALAPPSPAISTCGAAKLKAAAKEAKCLLTLRAKQVQKGVPPASGKVAKCVTKVNSAFAKAEAGTDCVATGDASAIQGSVGQVVTGLVCRLMGVCP
jgi:poly(3-hydroxybutyrate) depolymerase